MELSKQRKRDKLDKYMFKEENRFEDQARFVKFYQVIYHLVYAISYYEAFLDLPAFVGNKTKLLPLQMVIIVKLYYSIPTRRKIDTLERYSSDF